MPALLYHAPNQPAGAWRAVDLLSYWGACVEATGDDEADRRSLVAAVEAARPTIQRALRERVGAFADLLDAGLACREGLFLRGFDAQVYEWVRERCPGHRPENISVCEHCSRVFRHAYRHRYRCEICQAKPRARPPLWSAEAGVPVFAGPDGRIWVRFHRCEHCEERFESLRPDARFCCDAHRKRAKRGAPLPADVVDRRHLLIDAQADFERRLEAEIRKSEELERTDPELAAARRRDHEEWQAKVRAEEEAAWRAMPGALAERRAHLAEHGLSDPPGG